MTLDLIGGAGAGAVCLGRRLRSVWLDKTSSVNQTAKRKKWMIECDRESGNVGEGGGEKRMCVCVCVCAHGVLLQLNMPTHRADGSQ